MPFFLLFAAVAFAAELPPDARAFIDKYCAGCHRATPAGNYVGNEHHFDKFVAPAGGGFKANRNYPPPNLFVSMLQRMGIETDKFASASGAMRGLEIA